MSNVSSQIDSMVSAQAGARNITVSENTQTPNASITLEPNKDGTFTTTALRIEGNAPSRISGDGGDFAGAVVAMQANIGRIQSQLDEVAHDPKTGAPSYVVPEHSRERALLQLQAASAKQSLDYQVSRQEAIKAQRESDGQTMPTYDPRSLATLFSNGDPAKAKAILEAIERQSAEEVASLIRNQRK